MNGIYSFIRIAMGHLMNCDRLLSGAGIVIAMEGDQALRLVDREIGL